GRPRVRAGPRPRAARVRAAGGDPLPGGRPADRDWRRGAHRRGGRAGVGAAGRPLVPHCVGLRAGGRRGRRVSAEELRPGDLEVIAAQLGRPPRGVVGVAARCVCGRPLVVRTAPRLEDGTPFPTTFYLTSPGSVKAVGTLEAEGVMRQMTDRLATDEEL